MQIQIQTLHDNKNTV